MLLYEEIFVEKAIIIILINSRYYMYLKIASKWYLSCDSISPIRLLKLYMLYMYICNICMH